MQWINVKAMWLTTDDALARLGTKPQTLYANVSRGRIRKRPDPADSRRSLYSEEDVNRLAGRQIGRRKAEAVAAETIRWGEPVLPSAISMIEHGKLYYRGKDAVVLSEEATLEDIAALLWDGPVTMPILAHSGATGTVAAAFAALATRAAADAPSFGRGSPPCAGRPLACLRPRLQR